MNNTRHYVHGRVGLRVAGYIISLAMMGLQPASADGLSIYEHNRSIVDWLIVGNNITVTYAAPRSGLEEAGVRSGTVLFKGNYRGERIDGTAYAFKAGCAPAPYDVTGQDNAGNIVLLGPGPLRQKYGYAVMGYSAKSPHAKLEFVPLGQTKRQLLNDATPRMPATNLGAASTPSQSTVEKTPTSDSQSVDVEALTRKKDWHDWPERAEPCENLWLTQYLESSLGPQKYQALYHLSPCLHASAANIESYVYAIEKLYEVDPGHEEGRPKEIAVRSLKTFSHNIARNPKGAENCFRSLSIKTREADGSWRDAQQMLLEFIKNSDNYSRAAECRSW